MMCAYSLSIGITRLKIPTGNIFLPLICIQMALSAERKRREKLKNDPVKLAEVLRKDRKCMEDMQAQISRKTSLKGR